MKISYKWLKRYLDISHSPTELARILTDIGLEEEGIEEIESIKGGLEGIVVGEVIECGKHPNADKLSLCQVNLGELENKQIVCGAPNVAQGQKVLVATTGTTLYTPEGEPWKIKKGKIRGEVSEGMICAEDELGLGNDHSGIIVLPADVPIGTRAKDYYQVESDHVFDIGLTPNRSDATCHMGVAKDVAAYLKINENWEGSVKEPGTGSFRPEQGNFSIQIKLEDPVACPRYSGVILTDIKVGPSPDYIQQHLNAIGVRPINNVVDITNFVLHELGQPLHAFDYDKVKGAEIRVKCLPEGTPFVSLDEKERKLSSQDLMICDGEDNPMCIGGVFGGLESGVTEQTTTIFLESAHFDAGYIRRSSTKHLLRTDAAKVFEKGSDPNVTVRALKRATVLLQEHAGAKISGDVIDVYPKPIEPTEIEINYEHVDRLVGTQIPKDRIHDILRAMEMEIKPVDEYSFVVKVPTNKADVVREVDIIEEVLRIFGFNNVPIPPKLNTAINAQAYPPKQQVLNTIAVQLSAMGFYEMMGLSLIESEKFYPGKEDLVLINNTSNIHLDAMRPDALLSGLKSVLHNINHQQSDIKLYEFGRYYSSTTEFQEKAFLSLFVSGLDRTVSWNQAEKQSDLYQLKSYVNGILVKLGYSGYQVRESERDTLDYGLVYHRGPNNIVEFGAVSSDILKQLNIGQDVFYAEFDVDQILTAAMNHNFQTGVISRFPSTERDLSLVIDQGVKFAEIEKVVRGSDKKLIREVSLFDVYKNEEQLGKGKKAYAVKLKLQHDERTLNDKEVDKLMSKLISNFKDKLGAELRK